jgi:L-fuculose-phosphate aldolase
MRYLELREEIVAYGKRMSQARLSTGTSGNLSIYLPEEKQMLISPSGIPYQETTAEDIVLLDSLSGHPIEGSRKPSSEWALHLAVYAAKPQARAVLHAHSTYCTVFSCLREPLVAVHYGIAASGAAEVPCAEYATFGTRELAINVARAMGHSNAVLLANHGQLCCGPSLAKAFSTAEEMEFLAEMLWRTRSIGNPVILDHEEMKRVLERYKSYGQNTQELKQV